MNSEKEHEDFETHFRSLPPYNESHEFMLERKKDGTYKFSNVQEYFIKWQARAALSTEAQGENPTLWPKIPGELNHNTAQLVVRFAEALADKLYKAEQKYGYSDGWRNDDWMDECRQKLMEHVAKGDPRDVAAYCAFLWHHGELTVTAPERMNDA